MDCASAGARVEQIAARVLAYVAEHELPEPDFHGGPSLEATIASLLEREQLTDDECFRFVTCNEEVDPTLDEAEALEVMKLIIVRARLRRGVMPDRIDDAVSL